MPTRVALFYACLYYVFTPDYRYYLIFIIRRLLPPRAPRNIVTASAQTMLLMPEYFCLDALKARLYASERARAFIMMRAGDERARYFALCADTRREEMPQPRI